MERIVKTIKEFEEAWAKCPEPKQCFVDKNRVAVVWDGDQNRFGDMPGRSFGLERVRRALANT